MREFSSTWIALVVGIHFIPLASLLKYPMLYGTAVAVVAMAAVAVPVTRSLQLTLRAVTGVSIGATLLATALISLTTVLM